jgi:hypothetical protein
MGDSGRAAVPRKSVEEGRTAEPGRRRTTRGACARLGIQAFPILVGLIDRFAQMEPKVALRPWSRTPTAPRSSAFAIAGCPAQSAFPALLTPTCESEVSAVLAKYFAEASARPRCARWSPALDKCLLPKLSISGQQKGSQHDRQQNRQVP